MLKIDLAGNLTKADHLHNSAHDEEFEYHGSHRLTKYIKDPDGSLPPGGNSKHPFDKLRAMSSRPNGE